MQITWFAKNDDVTRWGKGRFSEAVEDMRPLESVELVWLDGYENTILVSSSGFATRTRGVSLSQFLISPMNIDPLRFDIKIRRQIDIYGKKEIDISKCISLKYETSKGICEVCYGVDLRTGEVFFECSNPNLTWSQK